MSGLAGPHLSPSIMSSLPPPSDSPVAPVLRGHVPPMEDNLKPLPSTLANASSSGGTSQQFGRDNSDGVLQFNPQSGNGFGRFASEEVPSIQDKALSQSGTDGSDHIHSKVLWSWKIIEKEIDKAGQLFLLQVFQQCPEMLQHFSFRDDVPLENSEGLKRHGRGVMEIVGQAVQSLNNLSSIVPAFRSLVARHIQYGVKLQYLEVVGRSLLKTVEEWLGDAWSEELEEAWVISWTAIESMFKTFLAEEQQRLEAVSKALDHAKLHPNSPPSVQNTPPAAQKTAAISEREMLEREARSARWACVAWSGEHQHPTDGMSPRPKTATTLFSTTCKPLRLLHGRFVPIAVHGKDGAKKTVNMAGLVLVAGGKAGCSVMLYDKEKRLLSQATLTSQGGEMQVDSRDEVALELRDDRKQLWRLRMKDAKARAELLRRYALAESTVWGPEGAHLVKVDLMLGTGKMLQAGDLARLRYKMWEVEGGESGNPSLGDCVDHNEEDAEEVFTFWVGSQSVMAGLDQGVLSLRQGGVRMLVIPPHLGHGAVGVTQKFGASATLAMEVRLVDEKEATMLASARKAEAAGLATPDHGGDHAAGLGAWTHPPNRGAEGENDPIEVSLHPLGSSLKTQGVHPLTEFSSRKVEDQERPEGVEGLLSPDEDTPPSHGSHDGTQENIAVQLFSKMDHPVNATAAENGGIKSMVSGTVAGMIADVAKRLQQEDQHRQGLEEEASVLLTCGSEALVRQHSPRTPRTRAARSEMQDVVNVAESQEPEETAAALLVCGTEMMVRTPRKLDPQGSAGDGERLAAADVDGNMSSSALNDDSDDDNDGSQQTPHLHSSNARKAAAAPSEHLEAVPQEDVRRRLSDASATSDVSSRIQQIEQRIKHEGSPGKTAQPAPGPAEPPSGGGVGQKISDMVFGFVFPDAKKMGIPERMSEWGKDSAVKTTPRGTRVEDGEGAEQGAGRRLELDAEAGPQKLKEAMMKGVEQIGLPQEVVKSEIVQQCMDRIVQEASRRAAAVLEASLSAGVLDEANLEQTVMAQPAPSNAKPFHLFDSQEEQEARLRASRPDSSWINASADESFAAAKLDEPLLDLDTSVDPEQQRSASVRGKSLSDSATRGRGTNLSLESSRTDDRAILDLKASLAGDLARILASVGACRREGFEIKDEVTEAFSEALVRVQNAMLQAQATLGSDVKQTVEVQEEAIGKMQQKVTEVERDSRVVRETMDGWKAELQSQLKLELGEYRKTVKDEVEACRSEIRGLKDALRAEVSKIGEGVAKAVADAQMAGLQQVDAKVDAVRGDVGELKAAMLEGLAVGSEGGGVLKDMVLELGREGRKVGDALESFRQEVTGLARSVKVVAEKGPDEAVLQAVQAVKAEVESSRETVAAKIKAEETLVASALQAAKADLEDLRAELAGGRAEAAAAKEELLAEYKKENRAVREEVQLTRTEMGTVREMVLEAQQASSERLQGELERLKGQVMEMAATQGEGAFTEAFFEEYKQQGQGTRQAVEECNRRMEELKQVVVGDFRSGQGMRSEVEACRADIQTLAQTLREAQTDTDGARAQLVAEYKQQGSGVRSDLGELKKELVGLKSAMADEEARRQEGSRAMAVQGAENLKGDVERIRRAVGEMKHTVVDDYRRENESTRNEVGAFRTEVRGLVDAILETYMTETSALKLAVEKEYRRDTQGIRDEVDLCARKVEELKAAVSTGARGEQPEARGGDEARRADVQELADKVLALREEQAAVKKALVEEYKRTGDGVKGEVDAVRRDVQGVVAAMAEEYRKGEQELKEALAAMAAQSGQVDAAVPVQVMEGVKGEVENIRRAIGEMKNAIVDTYQKEGKKNREEMVAFKAETKDIVQSLQPDGSQPEGIGKDELMQELQKERDVVRGEVEAVSNKVDRLKEEIKVEYRKESKLMREGVGAVLAREMSSKVPEVVREVASEENNKSRESLQEEVAEACRHEVQVIKDGQDRVMKWLQTAEERGVLPDERESFKAELQQLRVSLVREQAARAELEQDLLEARKVLAKERKRWAANLREPSPVRATNSDSVDPDSPAGLAQGLTNSLRSVRDKLRDKIPGEDWYEDGVSGTPERTPATSATSQSAAKTSPVPKLKLDKLTPTPAPPAAKSSQRRGASPPPPAPPPALSGSRSSDQQHENADRGEASSPASSWSSLGQQLLQSVAGTRGSETKPVKLGEDTSTGAH